MALKFLNKKGWHTGSLRNVENVWKAEQKHEAEQKKLDELRKQIQEERERTEFRLLQEQAGLVPKQERLDFLYDSGLSVGKSDGGGGGAGGAAASGSGFKALEQPSSSATTSKQPGALFEDKPHSASDAWRKLHSDPLLLIRQREQEALARVKNNPVKMALIRKSVDEKKHNHKSRDKKDRKKKHRKLSRQQQSDSDYSSSSEGDSMRKSMTHRTSYYDKPSDNDKNHRYKDYKYRERSPGDSVKRNHDKSKRENYPSQGRTSSDADKRGRESDANAAKNPTELHYNKRRNVAPKLSEEERAARLREMQVNAELHEEHRWKRLRKAEEDDAREATRDGISRGKNFLDAAQKSVYGAEEGGSSTIEERVRRRTYYSQGRSEASQGNAFRR